jgi:predicted O-methyltransferase YrrM
MDSKEFLENNSAYKVLQKYTDSTWSYLSAKGLRKDEIKDLLEKETIEKFPTFAEMITMRHECDLYEIIVKFANAKNCLEVGVFTGSSSISITRGMEPDGKLIVLDVSQEFTDIAKKYWELAGLQDRIELVLGPATEYLSKLIADGHQNKFDFAYVDADKTSYIQYYELLLQLIRPGGVIAFDNTLFANRLGDPSNNEPGTLVLRELNTILINDTRIKNVLLPLADGVNLVIKL